MSTAHYERMAGIEENHILHEQDKIIFRSGYHLPLQEPWDYDQHRHINQPLCILQKKTPVMLNARYIPFSNY
jgi:hypothetical protein